MQQVRDLNVLPLNKTLIAMHHLGMRDIADAKAAQKLAEYPAPMAWSSPPSPPMTPITRPPSA